MCIGLSNRLVGVEYSKCCSRGAFEGSIRGRRGHILWTKRSKASNKKIRRPAWVWKYASHKRQSFAAEKSSGGVHGNLTLAAIGLRGWNRIYRFQVGDAGK